MTYSRPRYNRLPVPEANDKGGALRANLALVQQTAYTPGDVRSVTTAYAALLTDGLVLADATSAAFAVTLLSVGAGAGQILTVKKTDASANAVTITASGSNLIDGASTYALSTQYQSVTVLSDGVAWWVI